MSDHTPEQLRAIAAALELQRQADETGVLVAVSRQACDEAAALLRAQADAEPAYPEAPQVCAQAYQAVGVMLDDLGIFNTDRAHKLLDNLSAHRLVHADVLPWESVASPPPAEPAAPARPTDDALWDQTLRERDDYRDWADKLAESISRFIGFGIGEHSSANNPWARALDMMPAGTLHEALARHPPAALRQQAEPVVSKEWVTNITTRAEPGELPPLPVARFHALQYGARGSHSYLPADHNAATEFLPHRWVLDAMEAYARLALATSPLPPERVERVMDAVLAKFAWTSGTDVDDALAAVRAILEGRS